jgi:hypothetical protein
MTRVLARIRRSPFAAAQFFSFVAANIAGREYRIGESGRAFVPILNGF